MRPSALAVLRLMTSSNLVGCSTGRSAGFAPLRILRRSARPPERLSEAVAVAHQATVGGQLTERINCRNCMACCQCGELPTATGKKRIAADH